MVSDVIIIILSCFSTWFGKFLLYFKIKWYLCMQTWASIKCYIKILLRSPALRMGGLVCCLTSVCAFIFGLWELVFLHNIDVKREARVTVGSLTLTVLFMHTWYMYVSFSKT